MTGPASSPAATASEEPASPARGPVVPTASAAVAHRPLGVARAHGSAGVELTGGLLRDWRCRNREASLPLALKQLESAGNLGNLRLATGAVRAGSARPVTADGRPGRAADARGYRGPVFMDSDVYKTLEAVGWQQTTDASSELSAFADDAIALLEQAQEPDGYLNSYV